MKNEIFDILQKGDDIHTVGLGRCIMRIKCKCDLIYFFWLLGGLKATGSPINAILIIFMKFKYIIFLVRNIHYLYITFDSM